MKVLNGTGSDGLGVQASQCVLGQSKGQGKSGCMMERRGKVQWQGEGSLQIVEEFLLEVLMCGCWVHTALADLCSSAASELQDGKWRFASLTASEPS